MKWSITYFYNVRYLKSNQVPFSTAIFPPKWFHKNNDGHVYLDSNKVVIGLTAKCFVPKLQEECPCEVKDNSKCSFLKMYRKQLDTLNFNNIVDEIETVAKKITEIMQVENPEIVLLVFEKPDNPCSERVVLREWFEKHDKELFELEVNK